MKLGVKRLVPDARMPAFASDGAACFDLYAVSASLDHSTAIYGTGLAFDIPEGYCLKVYSRSGHGFKNDIRLANCVGIIDSDYTGEVKVKLASDNRSWRYPWPHVGERIAQAMLVKLVDTEFVEVDELKRTTRGDGGFGSTGNE